MNKSSEFDFSHHSPVTTVFVIPPRVHLLDITGPAHVFYEAADGGAPLELHYVSLHKNVSVETSSGGLSFAALEDFEKLTLKKDDIIFIPGLESHLLVSAPFLKEIDNFLRWLRAQQKIGVKICSVCTGAFIVAWSGVMEGHQATTHWKFQELMQQTFPGIQVLQNRLFVQDGLLYSSAGVSSGIDLSLFLLGQMYGSRFSAAIAREIVIYLRRGAEDPQLSIFLQYRNHLEDRIHKVQDWLIQNLNKKVTADFLSEMVHTSPRNLTRLFKDTTGITIGQYVEKLRVSHALHLLQENQKVEQVARSCGLQSTNQLRTLLKKHAGILPTEIMS